MSEDITFCSDMTVELVDSMGSDMSFIRAAKVSTRGVGDVGMMTQEGVKRFLNFLIANRHSSPFEHGVVSFRIHAPIFVWREFMRHRLASYNEQSGRYMELAPIFYIPDYDRPVRQVGKVGEYRFVEDPDASLVARSEQMAAIASAWTSYRAQLDAGVAKEVARMALPLSIYSMAYVTMNVRAITNFLSLRTKREDAIFPSFPQREIEMVAEQMEDIVMSLFPVTMDLWNDNGRFPL